MPLLAFDGQVARQRAAPAVFNHIAQFVHGGRFADDAVVDKLVTRFQHIDDFGRTIQCVALFVGSNQECNAALMAKKAQAASSPNAACQARCMTQAQTATPRPRVMNAVSPRKKRPS